MPLSRLTSENHLPEYRVNRIVCEYCKHEMQEEGVKSTTNDNRSYIFCTLCDVVLCINSKRNCFVEYHSNK